MTKKYMSSKEPTAQYEDIRLGLEKLGNGIALAGFWMAVGLVLFGIIIMGV